MGWQFLAACLMSLFWPLVSCSPAPNRADLSTYLGQWRIEFDMFALHFANDQLAVVRLVQRAYPGAERRKLYAKAISGRSAALRAIERDFLALRPPERARRLHELTGQLMETLILSERQLATAMAQNASTTQLKRLQSDADREEGRSVARLRSEYGVMARSAPQWAKDEDLAFGHPGVL